ncbi:MAG: GNAT family N-acetyltransferase [Candidatus Helarchaeales archaeon]
MDGTALIKYEVLEPNQWDYKEISDFFHRSWFPQEKYSNGTMDFSPEDLKGLFENFEAAITIHAFDQKEMIGFVTAFPQQLRLQGESFKGLVPMFLFVLEEYRRQKVATNMMTRLMDFARESGYELMVSGPEKSGNGNRLLEKLGWKPQGKFESKIGFVRFDKLSEYRGLNIVERKVATSWAKSQEKLPRITSGFREARESDHSSIVNLLNSNPAIINRTWSVETYKKFLELSKRYDGKSWVWEKDGSIIATGITTLHSIHWANGDGYTIFLRQIGISNDLPIDEARAFFGQMLQLAKETNDEVIALKIPVGQHLEKQLKKADFHGDQKGRVFMVYPISEKAESLIPDKKIKEFYFDII